MILRKSKADHVRIEELLRESGFLSVNQMAVQHILNECFSIVKTNSVPDIAMLWKKNEQKYSTRSVDNGSLQIQEPASSKKYDGFVQNATRAWNLLPEGTRLTKSKKSFQNCVITYKCAIY